MIGIIIGLTTTIIVFFKLTSLKFMTKHFCESNSTKTEIRNYKANVGMYSVIAALVLSISIDGAICGAIGPVRTEQSELIATQEIIALKDSFSISGDFFLGSGSFNSNPYYVYYTNTKHGYKQEKLNANDYHHPVYINYISPNETPHIDQYSLVSRKTITKEPSIWLSIIHYLNYKNYKTGDVVQEAIESPSLFSSVNGYYDNFRIEIFIPEGSILQDYKIDME